MDKKGSMELGINAIVVLIIALAILGLGIGFVTKLFGGSQDKLAGIIDRTELPIHADSANPIVFEKSTVKLKANKNEKLTVSAYNDLNGEAIDVSITLGGTNGFCIDSDNTDAIGITLVSPTQKIPAGLDGGFAVLFQDDGSSAKGTYICTLQAELTDASGATSTPSKQMYVEIV